MCATIPVTSLVYAAVGYWKSELGLGTKVGTNEVYVAKEKGTLAAGL
jgi:hypothetical protein